MAAVYPLYTSNVVVSGSLSADNMGTMRNKILNGDMRLDKANAGAGHAAVATASASNVRASLDKFEVACTAASGALCADQVALSAADRVAVGGGHTNAVQISAFPTVGLVQSYSFDNNANDQTGNGFNLSTTGTVSYTSGVVGNTAIAISNTISSQVAPTNFVQGTNSVQAPPMTLAYWFRTTSVSQFQNPVAICDNTFTNGGIITQINNNGQFVINIGGIDLGTSANYLSTNTWYHVCASVTSSRLFSLYMNGVLIGTATATSTPLTKSTLLRVGGAGDNARGFDGAIDDVRIYNRVLADSEIRALASFTGIYPAPSSGLIARVEFDGALTDSVGLLSSPVFTGTQVYSANCRSGTSALDLTVNSGGGSVATAYVSYTVPSTLTAPYALSMWINPSITNAVQLLVNIGNTTAGNNGTGTQLWITANAGIQFDTYFGSTTNYNGGSPANTIVANTWQHVCLTAQYNSNVIVYVNGLPIGSSSSVIPASGNLVSMTGAAVSQLRLGAQTGTATYGFKGLMDDFRYYTTALTPQQVAGLYYSYAPLGASLYRQPIDGTQLADLAWGTAAAQPAVLSCWVKNQSTVAQQYAVSVNNNAGLVAYLPFDGSTADQMGGVTGPVVTGTLAYSSSAKVGSQCLDTTANTPNTGATTCIEYFIESSSTFTISTWINPSVNNVNFQVPYAIGDSSTYNNYAIQLVINSAGQLYTDVFYNSVFYGTAASASTALPANAWTHVMFVATPGDTVKLYLNGQLGAQSSSVVPQRASLTVLSGTSINRIRFGSAAGTGKLYAYKGLIDDVRIYNRVLSASEIAAIYAVNASSTTATVIGMPRSLVFPTPSIPAGAWQRVSVVIPGDTQGYWAADNTAGAAYVALCAGAGASHATSNVAAASNNALAVWNSIPEYTATGVQVYGSSASNLLALPGASVLWTGVQLERGDALTPFEQRPVGIESLAATTTLDSRGRTNMILDGSISAANMGMFRNILINGGFDVNQRGTSTDVANPTAVGSNLLNLYAADRWNTFRGGLVGGASMAIGTLGATELPAVEAGVTKYVRMSRSAADTLTQAITIQQGLETANSLPFRGQTITFSFYYRTGPGFSSSSFGGSIYYGTGIDQKPINGLTNGVDFSSQLVASTNWTRASVTMTVPLTTSQIAAQVYASPLSTAASNWYFDVAAMQLERGTVATPFELRPYGIELQLCQRYYQIVYPSGGAAINSSSFSGTIIFNTVMRGVPTASQLVALGVTDGVNNNWSQSSPSVTLSGATIYGTQATYGNFGTSLTQYRPLFCWFGSSGPTHFSAEL